MITPKQLQAVKEAYRLDSEATLEVISDLTHAETSYELEGIARFWFEHLTPDNQGNFFEEWAEINKEQYLAIGEYLFPELIRVDPPPTLNDTYREELLQELSDKTTLNELENIVRSI